MKTRPGVLLAATMDPKGEEAIYLERCLEKEGVSVLTMDPGIRGRSPCKVAIGRGKVAHAAWKTLKEVRAQGREGEAPGILISGAIKYVQKLYRDGKIDGVRFSPLQ